MDFMDSRPLDFVAISSVVSGVFGKSITTAEHLAKLQIIPKVLTTWMMRKVWVRLSAEQICNRFEALCSGCQILCSTGLLG